MDEQTNPRANDGDTSLRELALALLAAQYGATEGAAEPRLLVGQLPPDLPYELPVPEGGRVLGTLLHRNPTVALDAPLEPDQALAFFGERLTAAGWSAQQDMPPRHGGFMHSTMGNRAFGYFYLGEDGPAVNVLAFATPSGRTAIHLNLRTEGGATAFGGLPSGPRQRRMGPDIWRILPPIAPPPRSQQWQEGGNSGGDRVSSSARLETDLDLPTVAAHYIAQLEKGGWQRRNSDEHDPVAWSTWTFQDEDKEPWSGLFIILKHPDMPRRYWVQVLAEWIGKQPQGGIGAATSVVSGVWIGAQSHTVDEENARPRPHEGHE